MFLLNIIENKQLSVNRFVQQQVHFVKTWFGFVELINVKNYNDSTVI
ncbi:MAG TPA: hypothetical protein VK177_13425 [Flavobacteriales bacterium]|nr:hypothetical protein [Flavobacteriales bacterium]